jgi:hypothetical protein
MTDSGRNRADSDLGWFPPARHHMSYRVMLAILDDYVDGQIEALDSFRDIPEDEFRRLEPEELVEIRDRLKKLPIGNFELWLRLQVVLVHRLDTLVHTRGSEGRPPEDLGNLLVQILGRNERAR